MQQVRRWGAGTAHATEWAYGTDGHRIGRAYRYAHRSYADRIEKRPVALELFIKHDELEP